MPCDSSPGVKTTEPPPSKTIQVTQKTACDGQLQCHLLGKVSFKGKEETCSGEKGRVSGRTGLSARAALRAPSPAPGSLPSRGGRADSLQLKGVTARDHLRPGPRIRSQPRPPSPVPFQAPCDFPECGMLPKQTSRPVRDGLRPASGLRVRATPS